MLGAIARLEACGSLTTIYCAEAVCGEFHVVPGLDDSRTRSLDLRPGLPVPVQFAADPRPLPGGGGHAHRLGASEAQRNAILQVLSGQTSEPGATILNVFAATYRVVHDPVVAPIRFEVDMDAWSGHFSIPGYVDGTATPIANPVTGERHRARVMLPEGFEYREAEFVSSHTTSDSVIPLGWTDGHGHIAMLHMGPAGPIS
jgi:hypothetical protein